MHQGRKPNRLVHEKSPYLLQHAENPVDWRPWGEQAFADAAREDKPIFLSIGYSTCHWCHVMAHESFEDPALAASLNEWFVPVKVDREERPDVDRIYMNAAFAMTGGGGWPLSVFLTPQGKPFYAGTYFPPQPRGGMPSFLQVLRGIHEAWLERRSQVEGSAAELTRAIERAVKVEPDGESVGLDEIRRVAFEHLAQMFDARDGGFGGAPKFPQPSYFSFLFGEWAAHGNAPARDMALFTLHKMARGGMRDQLGGGFHRYATDAEWRIPHFEKMLYDQAQLVRAYLDAYQVSGEGFFSRVAKEILADVAANLRSPEGAFYSALDADSVAEDGALEEGAYYVWTAAQIRSVLGAERAPAFLAHYGVTPEGNFERGWSVLHDTGDAPATDFARDTARLLEARASRPRPHLDDKVLASWDGLMISACARAASVLEDEAAYAMAERAADFVWSHLWDEAARKLWRRYRDGEAAIAGELSDYACLAQGELDLFEAGSGARHLERALTLTERAVELFWDAAAGGFFDTEAGADPHLLVRGKEAHDGAEPCGNTIAFSNLARLAALTGRADLDEKARRALALFASHASRSPLALTQLWSAAHLLDGKPAQIVIAGDPRAQDSAALRRQARQPFRPGLVVLAADGGEGQRELAKHLPYLAGMQPVNGNAAAYLCENQTCGLPITSPEELARRLAPQAASAAIP